MKKLLTLTVIFISISLYSTNQRPDILINGNDTTMISTYPLELLVEKNEVVKNNIELINIVGLKGKLSISSCHRGYVATWKIENDSLFLIEMINPINDEKINIKSIFPKQFLKDNKVFTKWYNGIIHELGIEGIIHGNFHCQIDKGIVKSIIYDDIMESINYRENYIETSKIIMELEELNTPENIYQ